HEKKRKRRHADVGHRIDALALPLVRKSGAGVLEAAQKPVENQHPDLESENGRREHQKNREPQRPFRIAGSTSAILKVRNFQDSRISKSLIHGWDAAFALPSVRVEVRMRDFS